MAQPNRQARIEPDPNSAPPLSVSPDSAAVARRALGLPGWLPKLLIMIVGLLVFILALQLLKQGAKEYGREIIRYLGEKDVTTRRLFEDILAVEEEHADDMADLLAGRE